MRELPSEGVQPAEVEWTLRDRRLWFLSGGSGLYVTAQMVYSFLVLYLHDERGYTAAGAAGVLAVSQAIAMAFRIGAGRWSDVIGSRIVPLRQIGLATTVVFAAAAILLDAPNAVVVPFSCSRPRCPPRGTGSRSSQQPSSQAPRRSGAAIGFQQTVLSVSGVIVPPLFATLVAFSSVAHRLRARRARPGSPGWVLLGRVRA